MTSLPWALAFGHLVASEHVGVSVVFGVGGRLVTLLPNRRPARGLLSRRVAIDLERADLVMDDVPGATA